MPDIHATSPFAEQEIVPLGYLVGEFFEHYQHMLTRQEEAVLGLRCIGWTYHQIAQALLSTPSRIRQLERQGVNHMVALYKQGK